MSEQVYKFFEEIISLFNELELSKKYEVYATIMAIVCIAGIISRVRKKPQKVTKAQENKVPQPIYRKRSQKEWGKILSKEKFRSDGSYYDERLGKWVGTGDYKQIDE